MRKDGNPLSRVSPQLPISQSAQHPQSSLLEQNLIRNMADKDWSAKKKLLDNPWS